MRVTGRTIVALLWAGLVVAAAAQEGPAQRREAKIGESAPEIEATFTNTEGDVSIEKYKGRIVLLFFFKTTDSASMDEAVPILNEVHKDQGRNVVIIGLTPESRQDAESIVGGKEIRFIVGYESQADQSYSVPGYPWIYMVDTMGVVANRFHPLDQLEDKLQAQMNKTPPAGADTKSLQNRYTRARTAYNDSEFGKAYTLAKDVRNVVDAESSLGKMTAKLLEEIEEKAKRWLDEAKQAAEKDDFTKACRILAEISVRFEGTDLAGDAENEIGRLMGNREVKPKIRKALNNAKGELLNDQAADREAGGRFLEAIKLYRQATEEYPNTDAADVADQAIERISDDPRAQKIIKKRRAEEDADRWLDIADRFSKVEMYSKAREYYQRVIDVHPTTRAGSKARERLAALPEDEPEEEVEETEEIVEEDSEVQS